MVHAADILEIMALQPVKPSRPEELAFYISSIATSKDEPQLTGGVIEVHPDNPVKGEEMRFDIALQSNIVPEAVRIPFYDGPAIDAGLALREGNVVMSFVANRWHFPRNPATEAPEAPPML